MMNSFVKDFIERKIDLMEQDLRRFLDKALVRMTSSQFEDLIAVLTESGIDFSNEREFMLINKLGFIFSDVPDGEALTDVIKDHLLNSGNKTFFGWDVYELMEFVCNNEEEWKDEMSLEEEAGIIHVRTQYDY